MYNKKRFGSKNQIFITKGHHKIYLNKKIITDIMMFMYTYKVEKIKNYTNSLLLNKNWG